MALASHHSTSSPKQHWYSSVAPATPQNTTSSPKHKWVPKTAPCHGTGSSECHQLPALAPQNSTDSPKLYPKLAVAPHHSTSTPRQHCLPKTSPAPSTESPERNQPPTIASASSTGSPKCPEASRTAPPCSPHPPDIHLSTHMHEEGAIRLLQGVQVFQELLPAGASSCERGDRHPTSHPASPSPPDLSMTPKASSVPMMQSALTAA